MSGSTVVGNISVQLAAGLLNHGFGVSPMPMPLALFLGLFTSTLGNGTEVAASGYARQGIAFTTAQPTPPVTTNNAADIQWPPASMNWGTVVAGGIFDQPLIGGNFYGWGYLVGPDGVTPIQVPVNIGDIFRIPAGRLVVGIT